MDCGCYCSAPAKLICIYWGRNKQGQERGSNPVNHLHSAVYNGASALLILISAGGTNIESDLFTHMARDYRSFIRYEKKYSVHQCFEKWKQAWLKHVPFQCGIKVQSNWDMLIQFSFPQYGNILENSDPSLVFCFMLTYTVATIMLAFALSTLFSR